MSARELIPIKLTINGKSIAGEVEPRTHLADFIRDDIRLTGTHLGCEHGVCGACTVLIDGSPARSCITFAVTCEGKSVRTIEGYDDDPVMQRLRTAFNQHHALQCGYCTPGMLATARDIVLRLPNADEAIVRHELAGNLCRCTGYQGIVIAICDVLTQLRAQADPAIQRLRETISAGSGVALPTTATSAMATFDAAIASATSSNTTDSNATALETDPEVRAGKPSSQIDGVFELPFTAAKVWAFMGDLPAVANCLPGASIESHENDRVKGKIAVKFGPMAAAFVGGARLERDDANQSAVLRGAGQDSLSQSRANGDVSYRLTTLSEQRTRVDVSLAYSLQGPLAQFSRSGLVKDFVQRMIADFAKNVEQQLTNPDSPSPQTTAPISSGSLIVSVLWQRIKRLVGIAK